MRRVHASPFVAGLALVLSGCGLMQGLNPTTRLSDQVYALNDEARWGRLDLAQQRCGRAYRDAFLARHARWGADVRVADADVTGLTLGEPADGASSVVTYQWIDERTMELHSTSVRQVWLGEDDGFRLMSEEVIAGEGRLFMDVPGAAATPASDDAARIASRPVSSDEGSLATAGGEELPEVSGGPRTTTASTTVRRDAQGVRID